MSILKKLAFILAICIGVSVGHFQTAFAYPAKCVAIISNYNSIDKTRILIHRANGPAPAAEALLYPGDIITGDVGYIEIERGPYADFHAVNGAYVISYDPPPRLIQIAENIIRQIEIFRTKVDVLCGKPVELAVDAIAKRSAESNDLAASYGFDFNPQPGFDTTLIGDEKVRFAGVIETDEKTKQRIMPKSYVIKDSIGQEVYSGVFNDAGEAELDLSLQNFQVGEKYAWIVDYSYEYHFTILDEETAQIVKACFSEIEAKRISPEQCALEKASWVQEISDDSDGKVDLYWLSTQLLTEISPKSDEDKLRKYRLLERCEHHFQSELDRYKESLNRK